MPKTKPKVKPPQRQDRTPGIRRIHAAGHVSADVADEVARMARERNITPSAMLERALRDPEKIDLSVIYPEDWDPSEHAPRQPYRPGTERVHIDAMVLPEIHARLQQTADSKGTSVSALVAAAAANLTGLAP